VQYVIREFILFPPFLIIFEDVSAMSQDHQRHGWESAEETLQDVQESIPRGLFVQGTFI
jgi:hypothetical protein